MTFLETSHVVSYSNVDDTLEGYKIKSALPYKIFSTLFRTVNILLIIQFILYGQSEIIDRQSMFLESINPKHNVEEDKNDFYLQN